MYMRTKKMRIKDFRKNMSLKKIIIFVKKIMIKRESLVFLGVITISAFLRFYQLKQVFYFGIDDEYQTYLAQSLIKDFHPLWIGVGSTVNFYLGPLWTYLTYILLLVSKGDPLITGFTAALLGVATTGVIFFVVKDVFGQKQALLTSLLYACLPLLVYYDQKYWNVTPVPLLSVLIFYSLIKLGKSKWALYLLSVCLALIFHIHLALVSLFPIVIIICLRQRKIKWTSLVVAAALFLAVYSPLLVFDYHHNWSNLSTPVRVLENLTKKQDGSKGYLAAHSQVFFQSLGRLWYMPPFQNNVDEINWGCTSVGNILGDTSDSEKEYWGVVEKTTTRSNPIQLLSIFTLASLLLFILSKKSWQNKEKRLLIYFLVFQILGFLFFPGKVFEYYLLGIFPFILMVIAVLLNSFDPKGRTSLVFVLLFCILGARTVMTTNGDFGLDVKQKLITETMKIVGAKTFELRELGMCQVGSGFRYLFATYGQRPIKSSIDNSFGWIYPDELNGAPPEYLVTVSESRVPAVWLTKPELKKIGEYSLGGYQSEVWEY